jgi:hypothetical protein
MTMARRGPWRTRRAVVHLELHDLWVGDVQRQRRVAGRGWEAPGDNADVSSCKSYS